jgi:hypothetical protein
MYEVVVSTNGQLIDTNYGLCTKLLDGLQQVTVPITTSRRTCINCNLYSQEVALEHAKKYIGSTFVSETFVSKYNTLGVDHEVSNFKNALMVIGNGN